jgi:hypothetical protein
MGLVFQQFARARKSQTCRISEGRSLITMRLFSSPLSQRGSGSGLKLDHARACSSRVPRRTDRRSRDLASNQHTDRKKTKLISVRFAPKHSDIDTFLGDSKRKRDPANSSMHVFSTQSKIPVHQISSHAQKSNNISCRNTFAIHPSIHSSNSITTPH